MRKKTCLILLAVLLVFSFSGCEDVDDDPIPTELRGKWYACDSDGANKNENDWVEFTDYSMTIDRGYGQAASFSVITDGEKIIINSLVLYTWNIRNDGILELSSQPENNTRYLVK
ncbi:hypothetical protein [Breznakiella homolactica]|uniref:Lipocalin-like domain-containing protein n=1 Tax=Breznakiella homolactica TaxID=2798577 RepID=A0A7T8B999_9SPIR|nr:hypothetical protein [Breznakiella homolactica]QQO08121.1 hypothetical protein JFL75_14385 [Breznakiella homolactica]